MYYNFCRIHQTLRVTPAQEAGLNSHAWDIEQLIALLPKPTISASKIESELTAKALANKIMV